MGAAYSLSSMEENLHKSLQLQLPDGLEKRLEYEFHSASYHLLTDIVVGLRTILGHMIKVIPTEDQLSQQIEDMTLRSFMLNEYENLNEDAPNVFIEIGIKE